MFSSVKAPLLVVNAKYTTIKSGTAMNTVIQTRYGKARLLFFSMAHSSMRAMMWISSGPMRMPISSPGALAWVEWMIHS